MVVGEILCLFHILDQGIHGDGLRCSVLDVILWFIPKVSVFLLSVWYGSCFLRHRHDSSSEQAAKRCTTM